MRNLVIIKESFSRNHESVFSEGSASNENVSVSSWKFSNLRAYEPNEDYVWICHYPFAYGNLSPKQRKREQAQSKLHHFHPVWFIKEPEQSPQSVDPLIRQLARKDWVWMLQTGHAQSKLYTFARESCTSSHVFCGTFFMKWTLESLWSHSVRNSPAIAQVFRCFPAFAEVNRFGDMQIISFVEIRATTFLYWTVICCKKLMEPPSCFVDISPHDPTGIAYELGLNDDQTRRKWNRWTQIQTNDWRISDDCTKSVSVELKHPL